MPFLLQRDQTRAAVRYDVRLIIALPVMVSCAPVLSVIFIARPALLEVLSTSPDATTRRQYTRRGIRWVEMWAASVSPVPATLGRHSQFIHLRPLRRIL